MALGLRTPTQIDPSGPDVLNKGLEPAAEDKAHLRAYFRSVRKHRKLIVGITLVITATAAIYLAVKPDIYEAQALVQIDQADANPALGASSKVIVSNTTDDTAQFNTQLQILTSAGLLRRVAKTLDLEHNQAFLHPQSGRRRLTWQSVLRLVGFGNKDQIKDQSSKPAPVTGPAAATASQEDIEEAERLAPLIDDLKDDLEVGPVMEKRMGYARDFTRLISINFRHSDPQFAAKVVNAVTDVFAQANIEKITETNVSTGDFLQKRVAELKGQIRSDEERLINYAKNNQILSLDANQNTVVERLVGLSKQLLEAENERKSGESAYRAALRPGAATALAENNTAKQIADIETRLATLKERKSQLLVNNTEEWLEVKETSKQIDTLETELQRIRSRSADALLTNLETKYRQALAREQAISKSFAEQKGETLNQNQAAINYRILQQEIETNKNLLDGLLQRYKENDVVLAGIRNNIHVVDYAISPDKPVGPKRLQGIVLTFFVSLSFSIGIALSLDYLNNTVQIVSDVENILRLPALGTIPLIAELRNGGNPLQQSTKSVSYSFLTESYRNLRTSVLLAMVGRRPKTLLVTSSVPREGKTTTAVNLAISLAQTGARVLMIDADLRSPRLSAMFGTKHRVGLSTFLSGGMTQKELLAKIEYHEAPNVHLLTAGASPPNAAELLGSERMRSLIGTLEESFTYILIDSPPVASFTDAVLVSSMVDGVLLVVQSGKTNVDIVRRVKQLLQGAGAKVFGVILNRVDLSSDEFYYSGYYSYRADGAKPAEGLGADAQAMLVNWGDHQDGTEANFEDMPNPSPTHAQANSSADKIGPGAEFFEVAVDSAHTDISKAQPNRAVTWDPGVKQTAKSQSSFAVDPTTNLPNGKMAEKAYAGVDFTESNLATESGSLKSSVDRNGSSERATLLAGLSREKRSPTSLKRAVKELPPAAPTGLTATAANAQVSLSWASSSGATSYNIKRATTSGGPYATIATDITATSYTDTGLG